jgi:hypothetical protein
MTVILVSSNGHVGSLPWNQKHAHASPLAVQRSRWFGDTGGVSWDRDPRTHCDGRSTSPASAVVLRMDRVNDTVRKGRSMKRYICAAGVAGALLSAALVIVPRTVQAAPVHAGTASIRLPAVVGAAVGDRLASQSLAVRVAAARASRTPVMHHGTAATHYGAAAHARLGASTYARFGAAYSHGYSAHARYAATGTTHNCPHMSSTSTSTSTTGK